MQERFASQSEYVSAALPAGTVLHDRYAVTQTLQARGDDLIYIAEDTLAGETVRLTEYFPQAVMFRRDGRIFCRSEQARETLRQEVSRRMAVYQKLVSIAAVTVLEFRDAFEEGGTCYTVTCTGGTPLSTQIGNGKRLPLQRALALLAPVTDCLRELHAAGLFHGGVNPYHILTEDGAVTALIGFVYPPKPAATPFDAPEKDLGLYECGPATDVYAVAALLYELLTGFAPPSAAQRQAGKQLQMPKTLTPQQQAALTRALALDLHARYSEIPSFLAALAPAPAAKPEKKAKMSGRELLRRMVLAAALITLVASLGVLINYYLIAPKKVQQQNDALAALVSETEHAAEDPWPAIRAKYPDVQFPEGMNPAFAELYALNPDFAGWISIPQLDINFSVVQSEDNDYYLRRDFYGKSTAYGNPFFDFHNNLRTLDRNTVLYGHNMRHDDKLFGTLERYRDPATFLSSPLIGLSTLYADYTFKVYAVFISNSDPADDNGHVFNYIFTQADTAGFRNYLAEIDKRKLYDTGVDINESDRILTLSTCCYDFNDARLVVVGRMLRPGESAAVDPAAVRVNESPKYPQAYYDANRMENPYQSDPDLFEG